MFETRVSETSLVSLSIARSYSSGATCQSLLLDDPQFEPGVLKAAIDIASSVIVQLVGDDVALAVVQAQTESDEVLADQRALHERDFRRLGVDEFAVQRLHFVELLFAEAGAVSRTVKDVVEIPAGRVDGVDAAGMPAGVVEKGLLR